MQQARNRSGERAEVAECDRVNFPFGYPEAVGRFNEQQEPHQRYRIEAGLDEVCFRRHGHFRGEDFALQKGQYLGLNLAPFYHAKRLRLLGEFCPWPLCEARYRPHEGGKGF